MTEQTPFLIETELPESTPTSRGFGLGSIVLLTGIMLMVIIVGIQLARQNQTQPSAGLAPDFTLQTYDGDVLTLAEQRGAIVVVNFWGSWCIPCHEEAPVLQAVWERYANRGVLFIGIAYLDVDRESRAFIARYGITYPNGLDLGNRISDLYNIQGAPETFVVDRDGMIAPVFDSRGGLLPFYFGPVTDAALTRTLDALLAG